MQGLAIFSFLTPALVIALALPAGAQQSYAVRSPGGRVEVRIRAGERLSYDVLVRGRAVIENATASIVIDGKRLGAPFPVRAAKERSQDAVLEPQVRQKFARIRERYNELRLESAGGLAATFRAYDEGAAYRLETSLPGQSVKVEQEEAVFRFPADFPVYYPAEESFFSHNERSYAPRRLSELKPGTLATLPAVVDAGGVKAAIAEADIEDYPGLWLRATGSNALEAAFPPYPLKEALQKDRDFRVVEAAPYIAETAGSRAYPWRAVAIAEKDGELITNPLVWLLQKPSQIADASWIRPGKVAWDWWNALNVYGVDFRSGVNTATYKYFIDFAAKYGLEYIILDEGWYKLGNVLDVVPEVNMEEITAYARQKNVGVILWVVWKTLADQMQAALDQYAKWGVKGIKVDFMQRDDQKLVRFYHELAREAAKRKMLVDYHGAQRPAMMTRTWPNIISVEGVRGLEWSKWSREIEPPHTVLLPFTRMLLGPMDFTPGAMRNAARGNFAPIFQTPMSSGTRCHQLAMYVLYESPLQMLSDSPSNYLREPEIMEFLAPVPSVWDDTVVLDAKMGEFAAVARRNGRDWYVGAMTDWNGRELELRLDFLPQGQFTMTSYEDGVNAHRVGSDYRMKKSRVNRQTVLKIQLAPGGGWAARIVPAR
ncbi:MAG: glycoside hydrolase family 97 protein [Bryobacteraceae bacterium]|nr:glycoside hydrolase family 97 protein [Bryobacteraceae bacterium]